MALLQAIVERLAAAPGALAVSEECAGRLVGIAPQIAANFATPSLSVAKDETGIRQLADALLELVRAVADEQPLALLIDDLDSANAISRRVVESLGHRLECERVLFVRALHAKDARWHDGPRTTVLELRPRNANPEGAARRAVVRRRALAWASAVAVFAFCATALALRPRPARLVLVTTPLVGDAGVGLVPSPVVEVQDQYGRVVRSAAETIRVRVVSGVATLRGAMSVPADNGRAVFRDVLMARDTGAAVLEFSAARVTSTRATVPDIRHFDAALFLVGAVLDGQSLSPAARTLRVAIRDSIVGTATVRYDSPWPGGSVVLGIIPTWGDRRTNFVTVSALVTPARDALHHFHIHLKAPVRPGRYHMIFAFQAEGSVAEVASGTNWTVGRAKWRQGYDVVDWTNEQIATADSTGAVMSGYLRRVNGRLEVGKHDVGATAIDVVVTPAKVVKRRPNLEPQDRLEAGR